VAGFSASLPSGRSARRAAPGVQTSGARQTATNQPRGWAWGYIHWLFTSHSTQPWNAMLDWVFPTRINSFTIGDSARTLRCIIYRSRIKSEAGGRSEGQTERNLASGFRENHVLELVKKNSNCSPALPLPGSRLRVTVSDFTWACNKLVSRRSCSLYRRLNDVGDSTLPDKKLPSILCRTRAWSCATLRPAM
jgi:hypothetical protein